MSAGITQYLAVGALLLATGGVGVALRRDLVGQIVAAVLMLTAPAIAFVAFERLAPAGHGAMDGAAAAAFLLFATVADAALLVGLLLLVHRQRRVRGEGERAGGDDPGAVR